jgi:hypothetical protein
VVPILQEAGLTHSEHGQGFRDMSPPTKYLQEPVPPAACCTGLSAAALAGFERDRGDGPGLEHQAGEAVGAGVCAPDIDSIVATVMALSPAMAHLLVDDSQLFAELIAV